MNTPKSPYEPTTDTTPEVVTTPKDTLKALRNVFVSVLMGFAVPWVFNYVYDPIDSNWTVETFGCGCPDLSGHYRSFNANHFNAILWSFVFVLTSAGCWSIAYPLLSVADTFARITIFLGGVGYAAFCCMHHYRWGIWL